MNIASGAPSAWTSAPPMVGPATNASDRLPFSNDIASTNRSRCTTALNTVAHERSNSTDSVPLRNPTT